MQISVTEEAGKTLQTLLEKSDHTHVRIIFKGQG